MKECRKISEMTESDENSIFDRFHSLLASSLPAFPGVEHREQRVAGFDRSDYAQGAWRKCVMKRFKAILCKAVIPPLYIICAMWLWLAHPPDLFLAESV